MEDFNSYANGNDDLTEQNLFNLVNSIASRYDGKNQNDILMAIYKEAKKGKERGTLTNEDLDSFARMLSPLLDEKKKMVLNKIVNELKKI